MTLRAIGNTGHAEAIVPSLYNCIEEEDNSMDIRIAAIQAFRRLDCATDVSIASAVKVIQMFSLSRQCFHCVWN